ncbi:MAG: hypothetical protein H7Y13_09605 [Sphingobacteriaceae bacterium]|nr:hypothetical protein [Sphingobacteriaceae bacterium]
MENKAKSLLILAFVLLLVGSIIGFIWQYKALKEANEDIARKDSQINLLESTVQEKQALLENAESKLKKCQFNLGIIQSNNWDLENRNMNLKQQERIRKTEDFFNGN